MQDNIQIYVDPHGHNDNNNSGSQSNPVQTADKAFSLLPPSWRGSAEIIFAPGVYTIETDAIFCGTPIGPKASPLVIRGPYEDLFTITAQAGSNENTVVTTLDVPVDELVGAEVHERGVVLEHDDRDAWKLGKRRHRFADLRIVSGVKVLFRCRAHGLSEAEMAGRVQ